MPHQLGVIRAVGAKLTADQLSALARREEITRIWDDRAVELATVSDTVRDEFNAQAFGNDDGTMSWSNAWQEMGESDGPISGRVEVDSSSNCAATDCLKLGAHQKSLDREETIAFLKKAMPLFPNTQHLNANLQIDTTSGNRWVSDIREEVELYGADPLVPHLLPTFRGILSRIKTLPVDFGS